MWYIPRYIGLGFEHKAIFTVTLTQNSCCTPRPFAMVSHHQGACDMEGGLRWFLWFPPPVFLNGGHSISRSSC
ncbi:hypothetical protein PAXRUDRAFT_825450 [Paxillus rubicundulus Ve08.2h10]|uniref:Uncharacterized protein n=1 Tax=Paxillus rubicundulus Ve08.2h10 TaxID=930991 RepID=A0A0D0E654_9AGAM|nr:hypothetical protein PAXRUDRAFT_825450 [Paxillus rubicundulus Ve08.2h10]